MAQDLDDTIRENAQGPSEASGDGQSMKQHALRDQIEADRYLNSKKAAQSKRLGIRTTQLIPPGAS